MTRLSQGDEQEDGPSFAIIDGRNYRARVIDQEAEMLGRAYRVNDPDKPRESKREEGLHLDKKFGIAVCTWRPGVRRRSSRFVPNSSAEICGYLILIRNGEKLPRCNGCGKRTWVRSEEVIFQHDNLDIVRMVVSSLKGWQGRGKKIYRLPAGKLNEWAMRAESRTNDREELNRFFDNMPWNLPNFGVKL